MTNMLVTKNCLYCDNKFTGDYRQLYCDVKCRSRAAYHRFAKEHPDKKTKPLYLQRWYQKRFQVLQTGRIFELSDLDVKRCLSGKCMYCTNQATDIDRYDSDGDYTPDNVVGACKRCNSLKGKIHGDKFLEIINA
jgi:Zn finger protein HypA/HybF involved in hydrogenase expression